MRHCREQKWMEKMLSTFSKAHQWPECYVTLFLFGVQNELHLREQWGSGRDGCLLAQQGKELLYFAPRVPSLPLICAVGQGTDSVGQHLIIYSYRSERLAYKNALRWMHLHNSFRLPFPEPHMCAARSKQGEGQQRVWLGGLRASGGEGRCLAFPPLGVACRKCMIQPMTHTFKNVRPKIYLCVLFSAGSGQKSWWGLFLYLRDLVCATCEKRSNTAEKFSGGFLFLRI